MRSSVRIAIVCGTRPEIIKLAPVYHALLEQDWAEVDWIHTGQHADMADSILRCFDIEPTLRLRREGTSLEDFSTGCRRQLDKVLKERSYQLCLVQGDTESAFLGALCAFYQRIAVGHVEAGLRTYSLARPFPEEGLRQMISRIAHLHFAPTRRANEALLAEGIAPQQIELTGNTVVDAQLWAQRTHRLAPSAPAPRQILVTVHRREHWGQEMETIFQAVREIAAEHPSYEVLFPVHLNPVVWDCAHWLLDGLDNVRLTQPLDYLQMQRALCESSLVLTDSGGLQEEAPTYKVPVIVLRNETERPEAVEAGFAIVVGPDPERIRRQAHRLLTDPQWRRRQQHKANPYGDGRAAQRIARAVARHFGIAPAAIATRQQLAVA